MIERLKKLQRMSRAEMAHRLREQFRQRADRLRFRSRIAVDDDPELDELIVRHASSLKDYLLQQAAPRFYSSTQDRKAIAAIFMERRPEWLDRAIEQADGICGHRTNLLGYRDVSLGQSIDWHRDPLSRY